MAVIGIMLNKNSIANLIVTTNLDRSEVKILLGHLLRFTKAQLITHNDYVLNNSQLQEFYELCNQRLLGIPINYITGTREFYSREFMVNSDTLIPRPETELLVDTILEYAKAGFSLLDLGAGSGCIAISVKLESPTLFVSAVDKSPKALEVAKFNAANLGANVEFKQSDWFSNVDAKYDIIVSNPPYIHPEDNHLDNLSFEPLDALTDFNDGLSCLRHIITNARNYLNNDGILMVEHGYDQGVSVRELFILNGFAKVTTLCDYSRNERITLGAAVN